MRAKSKTGITSAKRKLTEIDMEFQERLAAKYAEPGNGIGRADMFHREMLFLSRDSFQELQSDSRCSSPYCGNCQKLCWTPGGTATHRNASSTGDPARSQPKATSNASVCVGKSASHTQMDSNAWPICSSGGNPMIIENQYQRVAPHEELRTASPESTPVF